MKYLLVLITICLALFSCSDSEDKAPGAPVIEAKVEFFSLSSTDNKNFEVQTTRKGSAALSQSGSVVTLTINLEGFKPNTSHAVHIHSGSIKKPGRHWNQQSFYAFCNQRSLNRLWGKPFAGDVGNVKVDANGNGTFTIQSDLWALNSGDEKDLLDRVIIVHDQPEDFAEECNPAHRDSHIHNNKKIAGGTIRLTSNVKQKTQMIVAPSQYPDFTICN